MYRWYFYFAAFIATTTMPVSVFGETAIAPANAETHSPNPAPSANGGGFYITLPAVNPNQLIGLIRTYQAYLTQRKEQIARYLDENSLDGKDTLISVIMPGGLLYAALKKGNLEQARTELVEITENMDDLSRDLLAMQAMAGELTVARLK